MHFVTMWLLLRGPRVRLALGTTDQDISTELKQSGLYPFINEKCGPKRGTDASPSHL